MVPIRCVFEGWCRFIAFQGELDVRNIFRRDLSNLSFLEQFVRTFVIFGIVTFVVNFFYKSATSDWLIQPLLSLLSTIWTSLLFTVLLHFLARRYEGTSARSKHDS